MSSIYPFPHRFCHEDAGTSGYSLLSLSMESLIFVGFWSSGKLTGNQTWDCPPVDCIVFWSSGKLYGNQTVGGLLDSMGD